jgi:hypothetical protein
VIVVFRCIVLLRCVANAVDRCRVASRPGGGQGQGQGEEEQTPDERTTQEMTTEETPETPTSTTDAG